MWPRRHTVCMHFVLAHHPATHPALSYHSLQEVPFEDPHLAPLSPFHCAFSPPNGLLSPDGVLSPSYGTELQSYLSRRPLSPLLSPTIQPPGSQTMGESPPSTFRSPGLAEQLTASLRQIIAGATGSASEPLGVSASAVITTSGGDNTAAAPPQIKRSSSLAIDLGCLLPGDRTSIEGLPPQLKEGGALRIRAPVPNGGASALSGPPEPPNARINLIRQELGAGEGVTALLERSQLTNGPLSAVEDEYPLSDEEGRPVSPTTRLRLDTFGATMDFMEALCDASSSLTTFSHVRARAEPLGGQAL